MALPLSLAALALGLSIFLYFAIYRRKERAYNELKATHKAAKVRFKRLKAQRRDLLRELKEKKIALVACRAEDDGIKSVSASDLASSHVDETEAAAALLVQQGKIDTAQRDKALSKMDAMNMDFVGTCLTLGFIDVDCAQRTLKLIK